MIKTRARKLRAAKQLATYFRGRGKIARTVEEYSKMDSPPIIPSTVNRLFRGWDIMIQFLTLVDPKIEADLTPKPKAAPKPKPKVKANAKDV